VARPERQIVGDDVNHHGGADEESRHPEERTVMHAFPSGTVRGMFGGVGTAVLLEFGVGHRDATDPGGR